MYISLYIYRIPRGNKAAFLRIEKEVSTIYENYGALAVETYTLVSPEVKYGCATFLQVLDVGEDEEVLLGVSRFRDRDHHDEVMTQVDRDDRINELFREAIGLFDISRVVRGEFECVVGKEGDGESSRS